MGRLLDAEKARQESEGTPVTSVGYLSQLEEQLKVVHKISVAIDSYVGKYETAHGYKSAKPEGKVAALSKKVSALEARIRIALESANAE